MTGTFQMKVIHEEQKMEKNLLALSIIQTFGWHLFQHYFYITLLQQGHSEKYTDRSVPKMNKYK